MQILNEINNLIEEARRQDKMLKSGILSAQSIERLTDHISQRIKNRKINKFETKYGVKSGSELPNAILEPGNTIHTKKGILKSPNRGKRQNLPPEIVDRFVEDPSHHSNKKVAISDENAYLKSSLYKDKNRWREDPNKDAELIKRVHSNIGQSTEDTGFSKREKEFINKRQARRDEEEAKAYREKMNAQAEARRREEESQKSAQDKLKKEKSDKLKSNTLKAIGALGALGLGGKMIYDRSKNNDNWL